MKRIFICFVVGLILFATKTTAQNVTIKIKSGSETIYTEAGRFEELTNALFRQKTGLIKSRLREELQREFKDEYERTTRNEIIELPVSTNMELRMGGNIYLYHIIRNNVVNFHVTTPDVILGIGTDRKHDPHISIVYDVVITIPLYQNGTLESIRFQQPTYTVVLKKFSAYNMTHKVHGHSLDGKLVEAWVQNRLMMVYRTVYFEMESITNSLNDYLNTTIKKHSQLLTEFSIDETSDINVITENKYSLLFKHNYSHRGIVKRNTTIDGKDITDGPKSTITTSPIPVSTSPSGMGKKPGVLNRPTTQKIPVRKD